MDKAKRKYIQLNIEIHIIIYNTFTKYVFTATDSLKTMCGFCFIRQIITNAKEREEQNMASRDTMYRRIMMKRRVAKRVSPNHENYSAMCEQIQVCEEMCRPLTEEQIREYIKLPLERMLIKIRTHKFA